MKNMTTIEIKETGTKVGFGAEGTCILEEGYENITRYPYSYYSATHDFFYGLTKLACLHLNEEKTSRFGKYTVSMKTGLVKDEEGTVVEFVNHEILDGDFNKSRKEDADFQRLFD